MLTACVTGIDLQSTLEIKASSLYLTHFKNGPATGESMRQRNLVSLLLGVLLALVSTTTTLNVRAQTASPQGNPQTTSSPQTTGPQSTSPPSSPQSSPQTTNTQTGPAASSPKVTKVVEGHLELDEIIQIEVDHLSEWMNTATNDPKKLVP